MKQCFGQCEKCAWKFNGGCSEWNGYVKQNHCFHCLQFDFKNLKCIYPKQQYNCIAEEKGK